MSGFFYHFMGKTSLVAAEELNIVSLLLRTMRKQQKKFRTKTIDSTTIRVIAENKINVFFIQLPA